MRKVTREGVPDGSKYIGILGYFLLPDGFHGSYTDGLRLMADYFDAKVKKLPATKLMPPPLPVRKLLPCWCEVVRNGGRFAGSIAMERLSIAKGKWISMPKRIK